MTHVRELDTARIHREEQFVLHPQLKSTLPGLFIQRALCSLVNIAGILFIKCFDFHLRTVLLHGEHFLTFKDIFGLFNTSMGGYWLVETTDSI